MVLLALGCMLPKKIVSGPGLEQLLHSIQASGSGIQASRIIATHLSFAHQQILVLQSFTIQIAIGRNILSVAIRQVL